MKKIVIVAGGDSSEYQISLKSAEGLYAFIDKNKYQPFIAVLHGQEWNACPEGMDSDVRVPIDRNDFSFTFNGVKTVFDFAWITIHGTPGENGLLQGYFDLIGLPYCCCNTLAAALTFDKFTCNRYLSGFGILTAKSVLIRAAEWTTDASQRKAVTDNILNTCGLPCFVKSNVGGSSFGTTKVKRAEELEQAVSEAMKEGSSVIAESFLDGTEVTCGCYKTRNKSVCFPLIEIVSETEFFDYKAKYTGASREILPARIPDDVRDTIQAITSRIYDLVNGIKGLIRADYIICKDGIYLLEVNTTPGMTTASLIPQMTKANGQTMAEVMDDIISDILD